MGLFDGDIGSVEKRKRKKPIGGSMSSPTINYENRTGEREEGKYQPVSSSCTGETLNDIVNKVESEK